LIILHLPYPPTVNHYWAHTRNGTFIMAKGKQYRRDVIRLVQPYKPLLNKLKVLLLVYPPDNHRRDLDNIFKAPLDAMEHGGAYKNDNQICDLRAVRCDVIKPGWIDAYIEEVNEKNEDYLERCVSDVLGFIKNKKNKELAAAMIEEIKKHG